MLYHGGLTFYWENPKDFLKIPNRIAAKRIAEAVVYEYGQRESIMSALTTLKTHGQIRPALNCYYRLMVKRDVHPE